MPTLRGEARERQRRVIFNNDGCDVYYYPVDLAVTPENLLARRTTALAGTHVDAISYCTISAGFGHFTHRTRVGQRLEGDFGREGFRNVASELIEQGRDCLEIMLDFAHSQGMELFWSLRLNDTHDAAHRPDKPYPLFPRLKAEHPEWLLSTHDNRPPYGAWSAVDYDRPEIRELAYRYVEEICDNYDVDGVELDFFRHPAFFKGPAWGTPATNANLAAMTDLMRRIAALVDRRGRERGRPILLAIRTPDCPAYCRLIGLDLETWLAEGLVDLLIPTGYFQLNPWSVSTALAHRYGVKLYAGLSESRIGGGHHADAGRSSDEAYRARALEAWDDGADGVYLFNLFDPSRRLWSELGEPAVLAALPRRCFVDYRGKRGAAGGNYPNDQHFHMPVLNPDQPVELRPGEPARFDLRIASDPADSNPEASPRDAELRVRVGGWEGADAPVAVTVNGEALPDATPIDGLITHPLPGPMLRRGPNAVVVTCATPPADGRLTDLEISLG